jgi:hypothetical protein
MKFFQEFQGWSETMLETRPKSREFLEMADINCSLVVVHFGTDDSSSLSKSQDDRNDRYIVMLVVSTEVKIGKDFFV